MSIVKFIYFESCPNAQKTKALLQNITRDFEIIRQDDLPMDSPYRNYSSPTILRGDEVILGCASAGGGCSLQLPEMDTLRKRLQTGTSERSGKKVGLLSTFASLGSAITVGLCPLCIPAIWAIMSAMGLGFLVQESVLKPLLFVFLFLTLGGLYWSYRKQHGRISPLLFGVVAGVALYVGRYIYLGAIINQILMYGGIVAIIAVSFWNLRLKKNTRCSACAN